MKTSYNFNWKQNHYIRIHKKALSIIIIDKQLNFFLKNFTVVFKLVKLLLNTQNIGLFFVIDDIGIFRPLVFIFQIIITKTHAWQAHCLPKNIPYVWKSYQQFSAAPCIASSGLGFLKIFQDPFPLQLLSSIWPILIHRSSSRFGAFEAGKPLSS